MAEMASEIYCEGMANPRTHPNTKTQRCRLLPDKCHLPVRVGQIKLCQVSVPTDLNNIVRKYGERISDKVPYLSIRALGPRGTESVLSNWAQRIRASTEVLTMRINIVLI